MRADKSLKPFEIRLYRHYRIVHGVRIALAFVLTFVLVRLLNVPEGTWPLITLVVVMGPISFWGNVVPRAFQRIGGTILGSALGLVALVTVITLPVGLLVGILSGYYGGWLERILMRFTDVVMSMPRLILAFAFVAMLGPGLVNGALALALTTWPAYARQARSEIQRLRHSDYLAAAEMMGIRGPRLLVGHILPLCLPSAIVRLALDLAGIILAAAGLGFLGLGARPPMAEWGAMIADGMQVIFDQWWIAAIPGGAILFASLAFNLLGDGLRDILEPQHD